MTQKSPLVEDSDVHRDATLIFFFFLSIVATFVFFFVAVTLTASASWHCWRAARSAPAARPCAP